GQHAADLPRRLAPLAALPRQGSTLRIHDNPADPLAPAIIETVAALRRRKDPDEIDLLRRCMRATDAGHAWARANIQPGMTELDDAVNGVFEKAGMAEHFPHHAGHGLGLVHPEAPYFVRHSSQTLVAGDVVTLEPGLYVTGVGGLRIENNYLVTDQGYDRLSN